MRPMVGLTLVLLGLALLAPGCARLNLFRRADSACARPPCIGAPVPEIDGEDFDGKRLKLSDQRGKVCVLVFWFSKCGPCRAMIPHERELVERHRGKPFAMLSVNSDENLDDARKVIVEQRMSWPIWKNPNFGPISRDWGVTSYPAIFVIDQAGVLRYRDVRGPQLDLAVETLLTEKRP